MTPTKIIIIFILIFIWLFLIQKYPRNKLTRFSLHHVGPMPRQNELESSYLVRWSFFAWEWGILFFSLIFGATYLGPRYMPKINETMVFKGIFFFVMPLLFGMCILGGLYTFLLSLRPSSKKKFLSYDVTSDNDKPDGRDITKK